MFRCPQPRVRPRVAPQPRAGAARASGSRDDRLARTIPPGEVVGRHDTCRARGDAGRRRWTAAVAQEEECVRVPWRGAAARAVPGGWGAPVAESALAPPGPIPNPVVTQRSAGEYWGGDPLGGEAAAGAPHPRGGRHAHQDTHGAGWSSGSSLGS